MREQDGPVLSHRPLRGAGRFHYICSVLDGPVHKLFDINGEHILLLCMILATLCALARASETLASCARVMLAACRIRFRDFVTMVEWKLLAFWQACRAVTVDIDTELTQAFLVRWLELHGS